MAGEGAAGKLSPGQRDTMRKEARQIDRKAEQSKTRRPEFGSIGFFETTTPRIAPLAWSPGETFMVQVNVVEGECTGYNSWRIMEVLAQKSIPPPLFLSCPALPWPQVGSRDSQGAIDRPCNGLY